MQKTKSTFKVYFFIILKVVRKMLLLLNRSLCNEDQCLVDFDFICVDLFLRDDHYEIGVDSFQENNGKSLMSN